MEGHHIRPLYMDFLLIIIGTIFMAAAIKLLYDPVSLVTGGVTGIAIIIRNLTTGFVEGGIPLWLTNLVLNIPLFITAAIIKGIKFIGRTAVATLSLSLALYLIPYFELFPDDLVLTATFGGVISGIGIGMVFLARATTGGTDMLAAVIQHFFRHHTIAQIMQFLDGAIVLAGAFLFGIHKAMYAIIAIYITTKVTDSILEGLKFSKLAYIISNRNQEIADIIMKELERGVTGLGGTGMYSRESRNILFCVVSRKEIVLVKEIAAEIDQEAFVIVSDVREVFGEGFIQYKQISR